MRKTCTEYENKASIVALNPFSHEKAFDKNSLSFWFGKVKFYSTCSCYSMALTFSTPNANCITPWNNTVVITVFFQHTIASLNVSGTILLQYMV